MGTEARLRRDDDIEAVRRFFDLYARGLMEPFLAMFHPEARFAPISGHGRVFEGPEGVREFLDEARSEGVSIEPYVCRFVARGDRVVAIGSLRQRHFRELRDRTGAWVFEIRDGLVYSVEGFVSAADALEAAETPVAH